jgi:aspartate/methionine/tyrosine aminotransferase
VTDAILKVLEWSMLFGPSLNQRVAELVLRSDRSWLQEVRLQFQSNRDRLLSEIRRCPLLSCTMPQGNPFVFVDFRGTGHIDARVCDMLLEQYGIPCTAGSLHGFPGYVRIPFGGPPDIVTEAGRRIVQAATEIQQSLK